MPIYEYECSCCGARFEQRRSFTEERAAVCPRCQGHAHRLLHSVSVIFKGSGFYVTDYPKSGQPNLEAAKAPTAVAGSEGGKTPAASSKATSPATSSKEG